MSMKILKYVWVYEIICSLLLTYVTEMRMRTAITSLSPLVRLYHFPNS